MNTREYPYMKAFSGKRSFSKNAKQIVFLGKIGVKPPWTARGCATGVRGPRALFKSKRLARGQSGVGTARSVLRGLRGLRFEPGWHSVHRRVRRLGAALH